MMLVFYVVRYEIAVQIYSAKLVYHLFEDSGDGVVETLGRGALSPSHNLAHFDLTHP